MKKFGLLLLLLTSTSAFAADCNLYVVYGIDGNPAGADRFASQIESRLTSLGYTVIREEPKSGDPVLELDLYAPDHITSFDGIPTARYASALFTVNRPTINTLSNPIACYNATEQNLIWQDYQRNRFLARPARTLEKLIEAGAIPTCAQANTFRDNYLQQIKTNCPAQ